ncbi:plasmid partitioning protein RepB [Roseibium aggregatum]|uniref:plasmid partitioning protein RepB n=1 Tax=Roseibium aggregatum TaxID=187304 RepID=UPI003A979B9A|nr:plasmid partitioning protein RepB [Paracoccaceae bacterium]
MTSSKASTRAKKLAGMFGQVDPEALAKQAANEKSTEKSMTTAPTKALQASFASIEKDNLSLREELKKSKVHELDPDLVLASLIPDRMEWTEDDPQFQSLVASMEASGQKLPILVRPHPDVDGAYQLAYGARRNKAAKVLGRKVRAFVEDLSDEQLIVAQGLENNERKNLSFIEQAMYAQALTQAGYSRKVIAESVGVGNETIISKMTAIAGQVPRDICISIGPAPKIGRTRWEAFGQLIEKGTRKASIVEAVRGLPGHEIWINADSNKRFDLAMRAAEKADKARTATPKPSKTPIQSTTRSYGNIERSSIAMKITINVKSEPKFANFVEERISALITEFENLERGGESNEEV